MSSSRNEREDNVNQHEFIYITHMSEPLQIVQLELKNVLSIIFYLFRQQESGAFICYQCLEAFFCCSCCFRPEVSFNIRLLKAVQLMEFPLLRQWITQMVNDYLKLGKKTYLFLSRPNKCYNRTGEFERRWPTSDQVTSLTIEQLTTEDCFGLK